MSRFFRWMAIIALATGSLSVAPIELPFLSPSQALGATVKTRVTGANNWNTAAAWIQLRTGTAAFTTGSATVTGTSTLFLSELSVGDILMQNATAGTTRGTVASIESNISLTLTANAAATLAAAYGRQAVPTSADDVQIGNTILASAATVTLDVASATVNSLTFIADDEASSLTHSRTNALTVNSNATVNQLIANASWIGKNFGVSFSK